MDRVEQHLDIGGRNLSLDDRQFVTTLMKELKQFQFQAPKDRALMFHPLGGFQRYLIHKVTECFPKLTSFSIGGTENKRTVVCFKSKKKDQQQNFQPSGSSKNLPKPEYVNARQRSRSEEPSRHPPMRSRDSSRNGKRNEESQYNKQLPKPSKAQSSGYIPRPLRAKKNANRRSQLTRSRSLQSSPVAIDDAERYLTDDSGHRGRQHHQYDDRRGKRSSSLKPPSRRRDRGFSSNLSEGETKPRKAGMRRHASNASLAKQTQKPRMERKIVNGNLEDRYSCNETDDENDSTQNRSRVVRRDRENRKKVILDSKHCRSRERSVTSSLQASSEESDHDSGRKSREPLMYEEYFDSESDITVELERGKKEDFFETSEEEDDSSVDADVRPSEYDTLKREASLKKAQRNFNRIKRIGSHLSLEKPTSDSKGRRREHSSSSGNSSSKPALRSSKSPLKRANKDSTMFDKSSMVPISAKEPSKKSASTQSHAPKSIDNSASRRVKNQGLHSDKHPNSAHIKETPKHILTSCSKGQSKCRSSQTTGTPQMVETDGNGPLYAAPGSKSVLSKTMEKKSHSKHCHAVRSAKSAPTTPVHVRKNKALSKSCDREAQTECTGTLLRRKDDIKNPATFSPAQSEPPEWPADLKSPSEMLASMIQCLGIQQQGSPTFQPRHLNPNVLNAFHQLMQSHAPSAQTSFPPVPPHLMHPLYMSWLGAYYAGATGTWPSSAPIPFMNSQARNSPNNNNQVPPFDTPFSFNPNSMQFPRYPMPDDRAHLPGETRDDYYHQTSPTENYSYNDPPEDGLHHIDPRSYSGAPGPKHMSGSGGYHESPHTYHDYSDLHAEDHYSSNPGAATGLHKRTTKNTREPDTFREQQCGSIHLTDGETDASSLISSRGEVAVTSNPRGGVMIYVRSQPSSRSASTSGGGMHESVENLKTSDRQRSVPRSIKANNDGRSDSKRLLRDNKNKLKKQNSAPKNAPSSRKVKRDETTSTRNKPTSVQSLKSEDKNSFDDLISPMRETLLELSPSPPFSKQSKNFGNPSKSSSPMRENKQKKTPTVASSEEMILSLRRAPRATIEDDMQSFMSGSPASSSSSFCFGTADPEEKQSTTRHEESQHSHHVSDTSLNLSVEYKAPEKPIGMKGTVLENEKDSVDESDPSISDLNYKNKTSEPSTSARRVDNPDCDGNIHQLEVDPEPLLYSPPPPYDGEAEKDFNRFPSPIQPDIKDSQVEGINNEAISHPTTALDSAPFSTPVVTSGVKIPVVDMSDSDDESSSQTDSASSVSNEHDLCEPPPKVGSAPHNGTNVSDISSGSEGRDGGNPSDSSYDADQSRIEESKIFEKNQNQLMQQFDGDISVPDSESGHHHWQPDKDQWSDEIYANFVELYNIPSDLSDAALDQHLSTFKTYRVLRLTRVDPTHALCILPSSEVVSQFLDGEFPVFDTRPLRQATRETKKAAIKLENEELEAARELHNDVTVANDLTAASSGDVEITAPSGNHS